MKLDATLLGNAVRRLREGLARHRREPADEQLRDRLIQRFEFTYALTLDEIAALGEAFGESDLPYKVDVVDWRGIDDRFRQMIADEHAALDGRAA